LSGVGRWQRLDVELARWRDAGRVAEIWLRDDDAVEPSAALERLLAMARGFGVAATLAVIPARAGEALAQRLSTEPLVSVAVHGWAHVNHAPPDRKKEELGAHRPGKAVLAELAMAKATIARSFGGQALPMLVPPWNRIATDLLPLLGGIGFAALSVYGRTAAPAPIRLVNTHVDLIDWHGSRGGREQEELVAALVEELRWRRQTGSREPIGVLAHHLVHDEAAWLFLERLFEVTVGNDGCRWRSVRDLI
jgi:hypothetical protein